MKKLIYLLPILAIFSCNNPIQPGDMYAGGTTDISIKEKIRYFQDEETGICFAERGLGDSYSFTEVECTPAVMNKIRPQVKVTYIGTDNKSIYTKSKFLAHGGHYVDMDADKAAVLRWLKANDIEAEFVGDSIILKSKK